MDRYLSREPPRGPPSHTPTVQAVTAQDATPNTSPRRATFAMPANIADEPHSNGKTPAHHPTENLDLVEGNGGGGDGFTERSGNDDDDDDATARRSIGSTDAGTDATGSQPQSLPRGANHHHLGGWCHPSRWIDALLRSLYVHMAILLVVPVAFLVGYAANRLADRGDEIHFAATVTPLLQALIDCPHHLQEERGLSASFVVNAGTPNEALHRTRLAAKRSLVDYHCGRLVRTIELSPDVMPAETLAAVQQHRIDLERMRTRADTLTVDLEELRNFFLTTIDTLNREMDVLSRNPQAIELRRSITQLQISRHLQNWLGQCRASGVSVVNARYPNPRFVEELHRAFGGYSFLEAHLDTIGDESSHQLRAEVAKNVAANDWRWMLPLLLTGNSSMYVDKVSPAAWFNATTYALDTLRLADISYLNAITNAVGSKVGMQEEGLKLLGAVVACTIASLLVLGRRHRIEQSITQQLHHSRQLNRAVARFVPNNQLRSMGVRSITEVHGGDYAEIAQSLLFSDIRSFTRITESKTNAQLFAWLQTYFDVMSKVTVANRGFIDKFIGDAVFAVFTEPARAIDCAVGMHAAVQTLNANFLSQRERDMIRIGVGVHHGLVCCGVFGDNSRLTCTLVSAAVNVASRLEAATKAFGAGTLVSADAAERVDLTRYDHRRCGEILVQGSTKELKMIEIFQSDDLQLKDFKSVHREKFEHALDVRRHDANAAISLLTQVHEAAIAARVTDGAVNMYLSQLRNTAVNGGIEGHEGRGGGGSGAIRLAKDADAMSNSAVSESCSLASPTNASQLH